MSDLISREALKKAIQDNGYSHYYEIFAIIDNAPSVDTYTKDDMTREYLKGYNDCKDVNGRSTGHWIDEGQYAVNHIEHYYRCSECGGHIIELRADDFCKHCGADMRKGGDEE